jgi:hypothetical protein
MATRHAALRYHSAQELDAARAELTLNASARIGTSDRILNGPIQGRISTISPIEVRNVAKLLCAPLHPFAKPM